MTFRERLQMEHPDHISDEWFGGCQGCPSVYGYEKEDCCNDSAPSPERCAKCWNREMPSNDTAAEALGQEVKDTHDEEIKESAVIDPLPVDVTPEILLVCAKTIAAMCYERKSCNGCLFEGTDHCLLEDRPVFWKIPLHRLGGDQ